MIIYNVTVKVEHSIHNEWLEWMRSKHIPNVMQIKCFSNFQMLKVLEQDEKESTTYTIQYFCDKMEKYVRYKKEFAPSLQAEHYEKFRDKFVAFRTLMKIVL